MPVLCTICIVNVKVLRLHAVIMLTFPVGLLGLLITIAFVFGEKALFSSSISSAQPLEVRGYLPSPLSYFKK